MTYLRTVVTYHQPSEAEVDKAYLESEGFTVCLMNANTCRNELGPAFYVQLQVPGEEYDRAVALLKQANPQRFGSAQRVADIEKELLASVLWFGVPGCICAAASFLWPSEDQMRIPLAISCGGLAGLAAVALRALRRKTKKSPTQT